MVSPKMCKSTHYVHVSPVDSLYAQCYNACMDKKRYANFRVLKEDLEQLKIVAAFSHESMLQTFKRLVQQEYERLQQKGGKLYAAHKEDQA